MAKIFRFSFLFMFFCSIIFAQDNFNKEQLDSVLNSFVKKALKIKNETPDSLLASLKKDPYETSKEFNLRKRKMLNKFNLKKKTRLKDYFDFHTKKIQALIEIDSVEYDADNEEAEYFHKSIKIPNNQGKPFINCYADPIFFFPTSWTAKEGFGLKPNPIKLKRSIARKFDVIKNKGVINYKFKFFLDKNIPAIRLLSATWIIHDTIPIWNWSGKTKIPLDIYKKPLKGRF